MTNKNILAALDRAIAELESKSSAEVFDLFYSRSESFRNICKEIENQSVISNDCSLYNDNVIRYSEGASRFVEFSNDYYGDNVCQAAA